MKRLIAVLMAGLMLLAAGCDSKVVKTEKYGSDSAEEVIRRYMEDLEAKDTDDGKQCFPEGLKIGLGEMWAPNNDDTYIVAMYHWDLSTLDLGDFVDADEEPYESRYGRDFEDVKSCDVTCRYSFDGEGCYSLTFVTCRYMDRYYVIEVKDNGEAMCAMDDIGDYGSFTLEDITSYDNVYIAYLEESDRSNPLVKIWIVNQQTGEADYIEPIRRSDFWGMCWENDCNKLWIQSGDIGVVCFIYQDGEWVQDTEAVRPDYIVSKYD